MKSANCVIFGSSVRKRNRGKGNQGSERAKQGPVFRKPVEAEPASHPTFKTCARRVFTSLRLWVVRHVSLGKVGTIFFLVLPTVIAYVEFISPDIDLSVAYKADPDDPYSVRFYLENRSFVDMRDVNVDCVPEFTTSHGYDVGLLVFWHSKKSNAFPLLPAKNKVTTWCRSGFSLEGNQRITAIRQLIVVRYYWLPYLLPFAMKNMYLVEGEYGKSGWEWRIDSYTGDEPDLPRRVID